MLDSATMRQTISMLQTGQLSTAELAKHTERQIRDWDPLVAAFVHLDGPALRALQEQDDGPDKIAKSPNEQQPLRGIPVSVKDIFDVLGMPTTGGSDAYRWIADEDAQSVANLRAAGATIVGKTNTQELAYGVVTAPTKNPWNLQHIPGGSSGGSAVAVATGMSLAALGSDTGGSVRIPAACCGVVGFKPSVGVVSKHGVMPLSTTLDHVGVLTRSVADAKDLFERLRGFDPKDPASVVAPVLRTCRPAKRRLGIPWSYFEQLASAEVSRAFRKAVAVLESLGFATTDIALPTWDEWKALQMTIRLPEAYQYHQSVLEGPRRSLLKGDLAARLDPGKHIHALDYVAAQKQRSNWIRQWTVNMQQLDALILPTLLVTAPRIGEEAVMLRERALPVWEALVYLTVPANVLGFPAVSVPCGFDSVGLPIGLQFVGFPYDDDYLLELAHNFAAASPDWTAPPLPASTQVTDRNAAKFSK